MSDKTKYIVGTSGYSFKDWVGPFYPPGTRQDRMLDLYAQHFQTVELNFTFYQMPVPQTLQRMVETTPANFGFWIKVNREITHEYKLEMINEFIENIQPVALAGKLQGLLLQFPQSFHRTIESRKFLASALTAFEGSPAAVEFRHVSWQHPSAIEGLRERKVALVVPDEPSLPGLYHVSPTLTAPFGYLRLHSRNADKWHKGLEARYDYNYSDEELRDVLGQWQPLEEQAEKVYAFFNNCHRGQAANNAEAFRRLLGQL